MKNQIFIPPLKAIFLSVFFGISSFFAFPIWMSFDFYIAFCLVLVLFSTSTFLVCFFAGQWKEVIVLSSILILITQFYFRDEFQVLKYIQLSETNSDLMPKNKVVAGVSCLELEGFVFEPKWMFSKSFYHKSKDIKGRDNSHSSHFVLIPLVNKNEPKEGIQFLSIDDNLYRFHLWQKENRVPTFALVLPETEDLKKLTLEWITNYPEIQREKITWLRLYDSKKWYFQNTKELVLLISFVVPILWFLVGFVWLVKMGVKILFSK
ncbi:hypothetical protein EHQ68_01930 [Leptospira congkakensis]|uniref:Uncharacterized protein n=1 Tax=Leptospira congkakensis TaxID=2484932 RepID=A0A4Z1AC62_9LEPT|nr:hypothetical protein [Leptospira congkakensis]TGL90217.1 hypothetical protein EHQ69_09695 [Leptospira congkakensis]TGL91223.1 hypothetical protein EHQ68_01930 [Leptospira congkakensis]TGL98275.1 hypothetical protein EHQ70_01520 [Leptospira congkakensis]